MILTLIIVGVAVVLEVVYWIKRTRDQRLLDHYSITPEALHALLAGKQETLVFDVRLPLDLLVASEIIPGAKRITPREVLKNPNLIPQDKDIIVYCTCPSEKTSRSVLRKALARNLSRIKFLQGGLDGWKAKGYPVEPSHDPFISIRGISSLARAYEADRRRAQQRAASNSSSSLALPIGPCCRVPGRHRRRTRFSSSPSHTDTRGPSIRRCADETPRPLRRKLPSS